MSEELLENRNFDKRFKIYKATVKENLRPALDLIRFADGYAYASDGIIAVQASLKTISNFSEPELSLLEGKSIDSDSYKKTLSFEHATVEEKCITATNNNGDRTSFYFNAQKELNINIENVFSKILPHYREDIRIFSFSNEELKKLSDVLCAEHLDFMCFSGTRFLVTNGNYPEQNIRCMFAGRYIEEEKEEES